MQTTDTKTQATFRQHFETLADAQEYRRDRLPESVNIERRDQGDGFWYLNDIGWKLQDGEHLYIEDTGPGVVLGWRGADVAPRVGDVVTVRVWTDHYTADVVSVSKSGKTIRMRRRTAELVKPPVMVPGGFAGVVVENAIWETKTNPEGHIEKATLRNNGQWKKVGSSTRSPGGEVYMDSDSHYYDYGF